MFKKLFALFLICLMMFFTGCSTNSATPEPKHEKKVEIKEKTCFVPLSSANMYDLNFKGLSENISSGITNIDGANGNHILEKNFKYDIFFKPNGQILKFSGELTAEKSNDKDENEGITYTLNNKFLETGNEILNIRDALDTKTSPVKGVEIRADMKEEINNEELNFNTHTNFINWFDNFKIKNLLDTYIKEKPVFYRFITNDETLKGFIMGAHTKTIIILDCSSGKATEIKCKNKKDITELNDSIKFNDRHFYCAFLPYYLHNEFFSVRYGESTFGVYDEEEECIPSYSSKNIIIIFNDKICK